MREPVGEALAALADRHGVATSYDNFRGEPVPASAVGVRAALLAMGVAVGSVEAGDDHAISASLRATAAAPAPAEAGRSDDDATPPPLPAPPRGWGWMVQLYSLRSQDSWGFGDLADLRALATAAGTDQGADFVMVNPLHAVAPVLPQEPSPYFPTSRRFINPLYLRVEDLPELAALAAPARAHINALAASARAASADRIDRDTVHRTKSEALELLFAAPRADKRQGAFDAFLADHGPELTDFATFCALAERHGVPFQSWPADLRRPDGQAVEAARTALAERVTYHAWLQFCCAEQVTAAQAAAVDAGMAIGVVGDLAVGVDPGGADAWALQDDLADGVTIGAPPDQFNQRGQDWGLPPLLPARLAATGCAAFRDLAHAACVGGGVRIDHVLGLWRLWWVPQGRSPAEGTYVRYPAAALLGVLAEEAARAGAVVIGEDLGTVEPGVRAAMAARGVLGSRVIYFERTDPPELRRLRADEYDELVVASVTTHDLPTAPGWWAGEGLRVQAELGLLPAGADLGAQARRTAAERDELRALLAAEGLIGRDPTPEDLVLAMYAFLARSPARLVAAAPRDALGDLRQPNLPGATGAAYPSWCLPLGDAAGTPVSLDAFLAHPGVAHLVALLRTERARHITG